MIIGNGLLANALQPINNDSVIFFASGVSNSLETNPKEFDREKSLLTSVIEENPQEKIIYFSTCSVYDTSKKESKYVQHKLAMEKIIQDKASNYLIFRVGNAVGMGGNENTLFNYFISHIKKGEPITIYKNAERVFIDVEDLQRIVNQLVNKKNEIIEIAFPHTYKMPEIVEYIENYLQLPARIKVENAGGEYELTLSNMQPYFPQITADEYIHQLLSKYY